MDQGFWLALRASLLILPFNCFAQVIDFTSPAPSPDGGFGSIVAGLPDMNGNGSGDLMIGAPYESVGGKDSVGRVYLMDGSSQQVIRIIESPDQIEDGEFGVSVAGVPDVNGDSILDLAIGSESMRKVFVFSGATGDPLLTIDPPTNEGEDGFGGYLGSIPDLNMNGSGEILAGAPGSRFTEYNVIGRAYVMDGATGDVIWELESDAPAPNKAFGFSLSEVPDVNGDRKWDILVGEPLAGDLVWGAVHVFDGATGQHLRRLESPNPTSNGEFGNSVSGLADVNSDDRGDFVVGACCELGPEELELAGRAYLFSGSGGEVLNEIVSPYPRENGLFGYTVSQTPDMTGDGIDDFAISGDDRAGQYSAFGGSVYVFDSDTREVHSIFFNQFSNPSFGAVIDGVPDTDGDGLGEVVVGEPEGGLVSGRVHLYLSIQAEYEPTHHDFGAHNLHEGPPHTLRVSLTNQDTAPIRFNGAPFQIEGENPNAFRVIGSPSTEPLMPTESREFEIEFEPTSIGAKEAVFTVTLGGAYRSIKRTRLNGSWFDPSILIMEREVVEESDYFGYSIAVVSAASSAVHPRVAVGNPSVGERFEGRVAVFDAASGTQLASRTSPQSWPHGHFGAALDGIEDLTGDGLGEIIVRAPESDSHLPHAAYVLDGSSLEIVRELDSLLLTWCCGSLENFGKSVSSCPDLDGDGFEDILIGSPVESATRFAKRSGVIHVYNSLTGNHLRTLFPPNLGDYVYFGSSVSGLPDVSGDGRGDILAGAFGTGAVFEDVGSAFIFDGSTGMLLRELSSPEEENDSQFGWSVSGISDLDGDGCGEAIVGAPGEDSVDGLDDSGKAYVFNGRTGQLLFSLSSPNPTENGRFGHTVESLVDWDRNGVPDILIGAPYEYHWNGMEEAGRLYIFSGSDGSLIQELTSPSPRTEGQFGYSTAAISDLNRDGIEEIAVGELGGDTGRVYLFYSEAVAVSPEALSFGDQFVGAQFTSRSLTIQNRRNEALSFSATPLELVGDGKENFMIDPSSDLSPIPPNSTRDIEVIFDPAGTGYKHADLKLYFENNSHPIISIPLSGGGIREDMAFLSSPDEEQEGFAQTLAEISDLNGNGQSELLIGVPKATDSHGQRSSGLVYVYDPISKHPLRTIRSPKSQEDGRFGESIASVPDTNGDGKPEILVGAPGEIPASVSNQSGMAHVFDGETGDHLHSFALPEDFHYFTGYGKSVSGVPDVNGDGYGDIVVAGPKEVVFVFDGATGSRLFPLSPPANEYGKSFGNIVIGIQDLNGNGSGDIIVASEANPSAGDFDPSKARVYIYDGSTAEVISTLLPPPGNPQTFASTLALVPDTNGDGVEEIISGQFLYDPTNGELIRTMKTRGAIGFPLKPTMVAGLSDVTGDGRGDILIGMSDQRYTKLDFGIAFLFDGVSGQFLRAFISPNAENGDQFGFSLTGLDDLNADGLGEICIGAPGQLSNSGVTPSGKCYLYYSPHRIGSPLSYEPTLVEFDDCNVEKEESSSAVLTVRNLGSLTVHFFPEETRITGTNSSDFSIPPNTDFSPLGSGETREIQIRFKPTSFGEKRAELIVSTDSAQGAIPKITLLGSASMTDRQLFLSTDFSNGKQFGRALALLHDIDGNGFREIAIGAPAERLGPFLNIGGRVHILDSKTGKRIAVLLPIDGAIGGEFGRSIASIPDLTGDRIPDIAVGAPLINHDLSHRWAGSVYVYDGKNLKPIYILSSPNIQEGGLFGADIAGTRDLDGDGRGEIVVGAPYERNATGGSTYGNIYVFSGKMGSQIKTLGFPGPGTLGYYGSGFTILDDINHSGVDEIAFIGYRFETEEGFTSPLFVQDIGTRGLINTIPSEWDTPSSSAGELSTLPDLNGNGRDEIAIRSPAWKIDGREYAGRVLIYDGDTFQLIHEIHSPKPESYEWFGENLCGLPDVTGNGVPDLAVLAGLDTDIRTIFFFEGETGEYLTQIEEDGIRTIRGIPDINGDDLGEILFSVDTTEQVVRYSPFLAPNIHVSPTTLNFGFSKVGVPSQPQPIRVANFGPLSLSFDPPRFLSLPAGFEIIQKGGKVPVEGHREKLDQGGFRDFLITFDADSPGPKLANLQVASNDPDEPLSEIALTGYGVDPNVTEGDKVDAEDLLELIREWKSKELNRRLKETRERDSVGREILLFQEFWQVSIQ
ncbi:MAG: FG-GAP repeat protein [Candidatus Omnitrophica bacterium]|nr:FG-GAP repeat protein [Candidatus Omnitrophota bacterium]